MNKETIDLIKISYKGGIDILKSILTLALKSKEIREKLLCKSLSDDNEKEISIEDLKVLIEKISISAYENFEKDVKKALR